MTMFAIFIYDVNLRYNQSTLLRSTRSNTCALSFDYVFSFIVSY